MCIMNVKTNFDLYFTFHHRYIHSEFVVFASFLQTCWKASDYIFSLFFFIFRNKNTCIVILKAKQTLKQFQNNCYATVCMNIGISISFRKLHFHYISLNIFSIFIFISQHMLSIYPQEIDLKKRYKLNAMAS